MNRATVGKLVVAGIAIGVFLWGAATDRAWARWVGIGGLAAAWLFRFTGRGTRDGQGPSM